MSSVDISKIPDHLLANVFTFLDIESRLNVAVVNKRCRRITFDSHRSAVWRFVDVPAESAAKFHALLADISDVVVSLNFREFSPSHLERLPVMEQLQSVSVDQYFIADTKAVAVLATRFPGLESIRAKLGCWEYQTLGIVRHAFPNLAVFEVSGFADNSRPVWMQLLSVEQLNDVISTLKDLPTVIVHYVSIRIGVPSEIEVIDNLATSSLGRGMFRLDIRFPPSHDLPSPQTPISMFQSLDYLNVTNAKEQLANWLRTMHGAPKLGTIFLHGCHGLDQIWGNEPWFAGGIRKIVVCDCSGVDARLIQQMSEVHQQTLKVLTFQYACCSMEFQVSTVLQRLLRDDSCLEIIEIMGPVSHEQNSMDELQIVFDHMMNNPNNLRKLRHLSIQTRLQRGNFDFSPPKLELDAECDVGELARRLPDPECCIKFGSQVLGSSCPTQPEMRFI